MKFIVRLSERSCLKPLCESITGAFRRASRHSGLKKLVKLKSLIVRAFSKARLKFNIVIVQGTVAVTKGVL